MHIASCWDLTILLLIVIDIIKNTHIKPTTMPLTSASSTNDSGVVIASVKSTTDGNKCCQPDECITDSYTLYT